MLHPEKSSRLVWVFRVCIRFGAPYESTLNQLRKVTGFFGRGILFFLEAGPVDATTSAQVGLRLMECLQLRIQDIDGNFWCAMVRGQRQTNHVGTRSVILLLPIYWKAVMIFARYRSYLVIMTLKWPWSTLMYETVDPQVYAARWMDCEWLFIRILIKSCATRQGIS